MVDVVDDCLDDDEDENMNLVSDEVADVPQQGSSGPGSWGLSETPECVGKIFFLDLSANFQVVSHAKRRA